MAQKPKEEKIREPKSNVSKPEIKDPIQKPSDTDPGPHKKVQ